MTFILQHINLIVLCFLGLLVIFVVWYANKDKL
jgi:hypothetical protein